MKSIKSQIEALESKVAAKNMDEHLRQIETVLDEMGKDAQKYNAWDGYRAALELLQHKVEKTLKEHHPKQASDALGTVEHMDGYFKDCEESGQGINTKESAQMMNAMVELIKQKGMSYALELDKMVSSRTAKSICRRALLKLYPGLDKLFA